MAIEAAPETQQTIGVRFGRPEKCSASVVVCSLSNSDVTVVVDAAPNAVISMTAVGTDVPATRSEAGFAGDAIIGGLLPNTKYNYKVYQDGNVVSYDSNGNPFYFWTAPELDDDFILFPVTCDNNTSLCGGVALVGAWTTMRRIAEANPNKPAYLMHVDDILGYNDYYTMDDGIVDGYVSSAFPNAADSAGWEYDYALGAFSAYGLYDNSVASSAFIAWGQMEDRIWCYRNLPLLPQGGDHDAGYNEMSWDMDPTSSAPIAGGANTPIKAFTNAKAVYDAFLQPLAGASIADNEPNAKHWHHRLGCLLIVALDSMSKGSGDASVSDWGDRPTDIYGSNQCLDFLARVDVSHPFKMVPMANGIRYVGGTTAAKNTLGAQNPIGDNPSIVPPILAVADYKQLFTDAGGMMDLANTDGTNGVMFTVHGDWHSAKAQYNEAATGVNAEDFCSINLGTVNGSVNFGGENWDGTPTYDGTTVFFAAGGPLPAHNWWAPAMYVYGSRATKEIEVEYLDENDNMLWNEKFVENGGNRPQSI